MSPSAWAAFRSKRECSACLEGGRLRRNIGVGRRIFGSVCARLTRAIKLLAYVMTAFFAKVDWRQALAATFWPHLFRSSGSLEVLVGILDTTISPYLFFWQAAQEVEEQRAEGKTNPAQRRGASNEDLRRLRVNVSFIAHQRRVQSDRYLDRKGGGPRWT